MSRLSTNPSVARVTPPNRGHVDARCRLQSRWSGGCSVFAWALLWCDQVLRFYYSLDGLFRLWNTQVMGWNIEYTDEFGEWWNSLSEEEQDRVAVSVGLLNEHGPNLPSPHSSAITTSKHSHMRELR